VSITPPAGELSSDASIQVESALGLTDSGIAYAAIAKSAAVVLALSFLPGLLVYEIIPASSARFTYPNI